MTGVGRGGVSLDAIQDIAISGKIPTTAAGGGSNVSIVNISGDVRVTAGNAPVQVSVAGVTKVSGQIKTTAVGAGGAAVAITNVSGQVPVTAGDIPLPVNIVQTSAQIHVTAGGANLPVTVAAQPIAVSVNAGVMVSGQIKTTAVGAGGASVAITNVSGQVPVTAGNAPLPVAINNVSGQIQVTSPGGPLTDVCGVNRTGSALNTFLAGVSGQVQVTSPGGPLTDVCGVNRTGSAMNVFLAGTSAQVHVTAGDLSIPVTIAAQPIAVSIAANAAINTNIVNVSGQVKVTAGNLPIPVSLQGVNHAVSSLGVQAGLRSDMVFNALVSNPVKFGKLAQVAGAVCADIVAAVASRRIRVLGGYFNSTGTATAIFMTTGASAALTPKIVINNGFVLPINPYGYFETAVGSALSLLIEGGSVGGIITYQEVF